MTKNTEETTGLRLVWGIDPRAGSLGTPSVPVPYALNPRTGDLTPWPLGISGRAGLQAQAQRGATR